MPASSSASSTRGELLPGTWVEVLSAAEIAAQLDPRGAVDGVPFMPEMLPFCGRRFRVAMRAERTCVHPPQGPHRRLAGAVVLQGLRCDGAAHGGCQLGCMILWKEAWLRRVDGPQQETAAAADAGPAPALRVHAEGDRFFCQATELPRATSPGEPLWKPGQYLRLLRVRTFSPAELIAALAGPGRRWLGRKLRPARPDGPPTAPVPGPRLEPGQWVEVRSKDEILRTLDGQGRLRGLPFSGEMYAHCGRRMRVQRRVERIIDEASGRLRPIADTVLLEGAVCERYFGCARGMPLMWREAWLKPAAAPGSPGARAAAASAP